MTKSLVFKCSSNVDRDSLLNRVFYDCFVQAILIVEVVEVVNETNIMVTVHTKPLGYNSY